MSDVEEIQTQLKVALRRLAKAVVIVTCRHEERRYAMAATAVCEVSMEPPSMLVCINKSASIHEPISSGADFCLNILHASQQQISNLCSGTVKGEARFDVGRWVTSEEGIPYLEDAQANILCEGAVSLATRTHSIFFGKVKRALVSGDVDPLVYMDGRYANVGLPVC